MPQWLRKSTLAFLLLFLLLPGCSPEEPSGWQGYAEGDYLYVGAAQGGRLQELLVHKGEMVTAGQVLFRLDPEPEQSALDEAQRRLEQAGHRRSDLARGERPSEVKALQARRDQAQAALELARTELERNQALLPSNAISRDQLDRSRSQFEQQQALLAEIDAQLVTAKLGGRIDQQRAQEAEVAALQEAVSQAQWRLEQKASTASTEALVFDTLYEPGELVAANVPVVVLLPPQGRKARFYVPEASFASLRIGMSVWLRFDGGELPATISYIAPQAEYTPPVIYSRETRDKLVFMVEARPAPADAGKLTPGQPLEVVLR